MIDQYLKQGNIHEIKMYPVYDEKKACLEIERLKTNQCIAEQLNFYLNRKIDDDFIIWTIKSYLVARRICFEENLNDLYKFTDNIYKILKDRADANGQTVFHISMLLEFVSSFGEEILPPIEKYQTTAYYKQEDPCEKTGFLSQFHYILDCLCMNSNSIPWNTSIEYYYHGIIKIISFVEESILPIFQPMLIAMNISLNQLNCGFIIQRSLEDILLFRYLVGTNFVIFDQFILKDLYFLIASYIV